MPAARSGAFVKTGSGRRGRGAAPRAGTRGARRMRDGRPHLLVGRGVLLLEFGGVAQLLAREGGGEAHPFGSCCSYGGSCLLTGCARLLALRSGANGLDAVYGLPVLGSEALVVLRARQCEQRACS